MMRIMGVLLALVVTTGCARSPGSEGSQAPQEPGTTPKMEPLVGTWERVTRCEELVSALKQSGLEEWILEFIAGNGFVPGVTSADEIADPAHPCERAVPREHSHFFTPEGEFGSLDWNGEQVDDGTYEIIDDHAFVVSKEFPDVTFNYSIRDDTITFDPVIPDCAPGCFEAAWSVTVAYPGETWERVS
jgi:hypothetical protein